LLVFVLSQFPYMVTTLSGRMLNDLCLEIYKCNNASTSTAASACYSYSMQ